MFDRITSFSHFSYPGVPFPRNLKLERQLTNSVLISWQSPEGANVGDIQSYHVYVDTEFKTSVKATERTKALLESVDNARVSRLQFVLQ